MDWFVPSPTVLPSARMDLSLGLRAAMRWHQERVVPGVGGVLFVRQLSWAVAGLQLARADHGHAKDHANAIEALACKLHFVVTGDAEDAPRYKGRRRFGSETGARRWTYRDLARPSNYVVQTYRQATTRALPLHGLGFTESSGRFATMTLTPSGEALANAFLTQHDRRPHLRLWLESWLAGKASIGDETDLKNLCRLLAPGDASPEERRIVAERLRSCSELSDPEQRRRHLMGLLLRTDGNLDVQAVCKALEARDEHGRRHARDIRTAILFEETRDEAVRALSATATALVDRHAAVSADALATNAEIAAALDTFAAASGRLLDAFRRNGEAHGDDRRFAELGTLAPADRLLALVRCDSRILLALDRKITGGPAFRTGFGPADPDRTALEDEDADITGGGALRPWRLHQFTTLVREATAHD